MPQLTWLVTGYSSGFDEQFIHSILARGDNVIATTARGHERLQHLEDDGAAIVEELESFKPLSRTRVVAWTNTRPLTATPGYARALEQTSSAPSISLALSCPILEKSTKASSCS